MATIRDVARESGVSVATVSYVLNDGPRPVREETRRQVLAAMDRLGYHPNGLARALARRRVHTLGVLFGRVEPAIVTNEYFTGILQGVMTEAAARGYNVTLFTRPWEDAARSAPLLNDGRTDGALVIAPLKGTDVVEGLARLDLPLVVVSAAPAPATSIPFVDVDNELGARLATEHLLSLGHKRIAHLMGEEAQPSVPARRGGFRAAMDRAGIEVPPADLVSSRYNVEGGYEAMRRLLALPQPPTAIVAGNDALALGAMSAAREFGVAVPDQLSVVGFDDIASARLVTPPLTTVRQPLAEMGAEATRLLIAQIEKEPIDRLACCVEPELILRGSTAPLVS
jgi:LacI family transcriptional regulator